jgi:hypothetical protein
MTATLRRNSTFEASPERVLAAATDPEMVKARVKPGTSAGCSVREVSRDEARLIQELDSDDYARTKTGGLDRSRVERSVTRYEWDLAARHCSWTHRGGFEKVRLAGTIDIRPSAAGAELSTTFEIDVHMPLIGRMVERMIASELEEDLPRYEALFRTQVRSSRA